MGKYVFDNTIKGKHKAFDQQLYDKYDTSARNKIKEIFKDFVKDNPNIYAQDLIITYEDYKYQFIE